MNRKQMVVLGIGIFILIFIFGNSGTDGSSSGALSEFFARFIFRFIPESSMSFYELHFLIRKLAHFTEYALLGIACSCFFALGKNGLLKSSFTVLFIGLFTAVTDELFQSLVPGRVSALKDVFIDFGGVLTGFVLTLIVITLFKNVRKSHRTP